MGLWEFLKQWRPQPSRITVGIAASIFLHLALVSMVLWGGKLVPSSKWELKKGDSIIVELPKPEEPASPGVPSAPPPPPARSAPPAPPAPPVAAPKPAPPAPAAPRPAPVPEERRVASAPRPPAPTPPVPNAAEPAPSLPKGTEPAPAEPPAKAAEPTPSPAASSSAPAAPARPVPEQPVASLPQGGTPQAPPAPNTLAALRRGGGGTGQGRGGIEGEAIPLESDNPRYNDYLDKVRRAIKEKWSFPCQKNERTMQCELHQTSLSVEFGILKDGNLGFVDVLQASPYPIYNDFAVNAIKLASFPPVPQVMMDAMRPGSKGLLLSFEMRYLLIDPTFSYILPPPR